MPALKPKEFAAGEKLMPISDLPGWAQPAFNGMQTLNRVQSRVADMALFGVDNMLLCAPTGAGKTNVAMLAILHELGQNMNEDGSINLANFKVVYVAPMKVGQLSVSDLHCVLPACMYVIRCWHVACYVAAQQEVCMRPIGACIRIQEDDRMGINALCSTFYHDPVLGRLRM